MKENPYNPVFSNLMNEKLPQNLTPKQIERRLLFYGDNTESSFNSRITKAVGPVVSLHTERRVPTVPQFVYR